MLKQVNWALDRAYNSDTDDEPLEFYLDGLTNSIHLDLLLGYFSSSAINVLSLGFATFLYNGGQIRLVINNILSENDKNAVAQGLKGEMDSAPIDLTNLSEIKETLDDYGKHFFECLAWLIAKNRIQIKIIKPKNKLGISHYKSGVFFDTEYCVGFKGSCNFTAYGLLENLEELDAFLEWENSRSSKWIKRQNLFFASIFEEEAKNIDYLSTDDVCSIIQKEFGNKDINELLIQENELLRRKAEIFNTPRIKKVIQNKTEKISKGLNEPKFPNEGKPRDYQIQAYENWVKNGYQGIFAMATGTGKTITSLNCLLIEYKQTGTYRAIITVPTTALLEQWKKECGKFNFKNIITVSSKENWDNNLAFFNTASKLIDSSFIVIVTYASLPRIKFQRYFKQLPNNTILIADETHNLGSQGLLKLLPKIHLEKRIGLSATPHRKFDESGNQSIQEFFNDKPPYIVSFTMEEALKKGWLCKYTYFPHIVKLTNQEMEKYKELSLQLFKMGFFDKETGSFRSTPEIEKKLLERKRIIHKATNKLNEFIGILRNEFDKRKNLKYALIYVPEGIEANYEESDYSVETDDENRLINEYTKAVSNTDDSILVKQFTANSSNRDEILKDYEEGKIHVLTSMKCLDEGVDVPRSELAIFCASTGNPRQFIQRRGRVLRLANGKNHATIHDLVVIPEVSGEGSFEMERGLAKKELERVVDFSNLAMNKTDTYEIFKEILDYYNINLNDL